MAREVKAGQPDRTGHSYREMSVSVRFSDKQTRPDMSGFVRFCPEGIVPQLAAKFLCGGADTYSSVRALSDFRNEMTNTDAVGAPCCSVAAKADQMAVYD